MRTRTAVVAALLLALPSLPSAAADNRFTLSDGSRPVQYGPICCIGYRWVIHRRYGPAIKFGLGGMYGARKTYAYSNGVYRMSAVWYPALDLSLALVFR